MSRSIRTKYDASREQQASVEADGEQLAQAIITRRKRKCVAEGAHVDNCGRCGINEPKEVAA